MSMVPIIELDTELKLAITTSKDRTKTAMIVMKLTREVVVKNSISVDHNVLKIEAKNRENGFEVRIVLVKETKRVNSCRLSVYFYLEKMSKKRGRNILN